jgi:hypothetical protein
MNPWVGPRVGVVIAVLVVGCASAGRSAPPPSAPSAGSGRTPGVRLLSPGGDNSQEPPRQPSVTGVAPGVYAPNAPVVTPSPPPPSPPPPPPPPAPSETELARWEEELARWEAIFAASPGQCRQVCMAAANICTAARELCRLTDPGGVGRDPRCLRALGRCADAGRRRDLTCPVCPRGQ